MDKETVQEWRHHPATEEYHKFLKQCQEEFKEEAKLNIADPDPVKFAIQSAYWQGRIEQIQEELEFKGE